MRSLVLIGTLACASAAHAGIVGQWDFNGSLTATIGADLAGNVGTGAIAFESVTIGGSSAQVAHLSAAPFFTSGTDDPYLVVPNPIGGNGGGAFTNQYSIVMDVFFASANYRTNGGFTSLYQTSTTNANDGDWFLRDNGGMGISGDYNDLTNPLVFTFGEWHRIALAVDTTSASGSATYRSYIDGVQQNQVQTPGGWGLDGRYSLDPTFLVFADNDGEINEPYINSLQFRDYAMDANEIGALGAATAAGIPVPEPASLCAVAAGVLALLRRRRAKRVI